MAYPFWSSLTFSGGAFWFSCTAPFRVQLSLASVRSNTITAVLAAPPCAGYSGATAMNHCGYVVSLGTYRVGLP